MVEKIKQTQEEEIISVLKREGFKELSETEIKKEPYKSIYTLPECLKNDLKRITED